MTAAPHCPVPILSWGTAKRGGRGGPFREMLAADPHVSARLTPAQVEALLDPAQYAGLCRLFAERGAARAREIAATIALLLSRPAGRT